MKMKNRKAQGLDMASILIGGGVVLVVATLLLAFSSDIIEDIDNDFTGNASAIATDGKTGLMSLSDQFGNVGTLLGVSVILGLVIGVAAIARFRQE